MPRKTPGPPCGVCGKPSHARNLCSKHYTQWHVHGETGKSLRPDDWGKRSNHPLNGIWVWTKRVREGRVAKWDDFYAFLEDVGDKPSPTHRLKRLNHREPWGPENFHWGDTLKGRTYNLKNREGRAEYARVWRANNLLRAKSNSLRAHYGIDLERYHDMLDAQGGRCVICLSEESVFSTLAVDHCHATGRVRGLLCSKCNRGLGLLKDDPNYLRRALIYLTGGIVASK